MRIVHFEKAGVPGIAADNGSGWHGLTEREGGFPGTLPELIAQGADLLRTGRDLLPTHVIDLNSVRTLPPVPKPPKILCVGLNYNDHLEETGLKKPVYPELFARFATSLIAHGEPIRRPAESSSLDYEAELAVVIGRAGRRIPPDRALDHVAGYSLFNDATIHSGPLERPSDAGCEYGPAHL
jgi:acylpyruvate hydrolase